MDQGTTQNDRLQQLYQLLQTGRLSEADYLRARVAVLKNEQVPADIVLAPTASGSSTNLNSGLDGLTVSEEGRVQRLAKIEEQDIKQRAQQRRPAPSFDPSSPPLADDSRSSWGSLTPTIDLRGEQAPLGVIQAARERRATREFEKYSEDETHSSMLMPLLAIFGIALLSTAIMTAGGSSSAKSTIPPMPATFEKSSPPRVTKKVTPTKRKVAPARRQVTRQEAPPAPRAIERTSKKNNAFKPLFGPEAIAECNTTCSRHSVSAAADCERSCSRLALKDYARRITNVALDPIADARKISGRCLLSAQNAPHTATQKAWEDSISQAMNTISVRAQQGKDYTTLRALYSTSARVLNSLALTPAASQKQKQITSAARQATCLRANLALTELAIGLTKRRQDAFSLEFYSRLETALKEITADVEDNFVMQFRQHGPSR